MSEPYDESGNGSDPERAGLSIVRSAMAPKVSSTESWLSGHRLTDFVGRTSEIARIGDLLGNESVRLLTITGTGGVGKTRLALECCIRLGGRFPDSIVIVPLAATQDVERIATTIAEQINNPQLPGTTVTDFLDACFHGRRILLVLDNVEHLLAAGPWLVDLLLRHPALSILATSRMRLDLTGEQVFPLGPLSSADAVDLFVRRATSRNLVLTFRDTDRNVLQAICDRLEGIPLAIELAASRAGMLSPVSLLDRLQSPLAFLKGGPRDAPKRLQTMRATIAWSYDLLEESHRQIFQRLAVFVGGFTLEAAQAVIGVDDALEAIDVLVASSMVVPVSPSLGPHRFTMLEPIREYGLERLAEAGHERETRLRHADFLVGIAERAFDTDDPQVAIHHARVSADLDNIRSALTWLLEEREAERAIRIAGGISLWWWYEYGTDERMRTWRERAREGRRWLERALLLRDGVAVEYVARAMSGMCNIGIPLGDWVGTTAWSETAIAFGHAHDDLHTVFWGSVAMGIGVWQAGGDLNRAVVSFAAALAIAPSLPHSANRMTNVLTQWGAVLAAAGDLEGATPVLAESLRYARIEGDPMLRPYAAFLLARALCVGWKDAGAVAAYIESLEGLNRIHDLARTQGTLLDCAHIALRYRHPRLATMFLARATQVPLFYGSEDIDDGRVDELRRVMSATDFAEAWGAGSALSPEEVLHQVRALAEVVARETAREASPQGRHVLTLREREVLSLLFEGLSNREIAERLSISERTAEHHVLHIMTKLDARSRTDAVVVAMRLGLL